MDYDIEILMPVCRKYADRISDFKRYGLLNIGSKKVLVSLVTSSNEEIEDLSINWPQGVEIKIVSNTSSDHVANLYAFYANMSEESLRARWLMRLDDDSSTDVSSLIENLDTFYDWEDKFYLGNLNEFIWAYHMGENEPYEEYKSLLGEYERIVMSLRNEVECGIISRAGLLHMLGNNKCMNLIKKRSQLTGGHGDCAIAVAAALAKFYPLQCPFVSSECAIEEFSIFGNGIKNHIHLIARSSSGDNFTRNENNFAILAKFVDKRLTEKEKIIAGNRYLSETEDFIKIYQFKENYSLKIKFENQIFHWMEDEKDGLIKVMNRGDVQNAFSLQANGDLVDGSLVLSRI